MFEKDMTLGLLLDFYGDVLSEHSRTILERYFSDDLSLGEIAAEVGISRQGVRHIIKKGEEELRFLEERLGLLAQFNNIRSHAERLLEISERLSESDDAEVSSLARAAKGCANAILEAQ